MLRSGAQDKLWNDQHCPNLGNVNDLCKEKCSDTSSCTAMNFLKLVAVPYDNVLLQFSRLNGIMETITKDIVIPINTLQEFDETS